MLTNREHAALEQELTQLRRRGHSWYLGKRLVRIVCFALGVVAVAGILGSKKIGHNGSAIAAVDGLCLVTCYIGRQRRDFSERTRQYAIEKILTDDAP